MKDLTSKLAKQMQEGAKLDEEIKKVLGAIGYEIQKSKIMRFIDQVEILKYEL